MKPLRLAVIGAGSFGRNHIRVIREMQGVELAAIIDQDIDRARQAAGDNTPGFASVSEALGSFDAAVIATPTVTHEQIAAQLLNAGIDVLVEKPIAASSSAGEHLARLAQEQGRILQVGHLERFNPAVIALERALTLPLFFEIHRLSVFTPRSLDIDVVLDLMIHDLDIVLRLTRQLPEEIRAAGISILSRQVDIANVRLAFANGCIANLTASRVSTEKVRKLRVFQPGEYISLDYQRRDAVRLAVKNGAIAYEPLPVTPGEPLALELAAFVAAVSDRTAPLVDGFQAANALRVAEAILVKIKDHVELVSETVRRRG